MNEKFKKDFWLGLDVEIDNLFLEERLSLWHYLERHLYRDSILESTYKKGLSNRVKKLFSDSEIKSILDREDVLLDNLLIDSFTDKKFKTIYFLDSKRAENFKRYIDKIISSGNSLPEFNTDYGRRRALEALFARKDVSTKLFTSLFVQIKDTTLFLRLIVNYQTKLDFRIYPNLNEIADDDAKLKILPFIYEQDTRLNLISSLKDIKKIEGFLDEFREKEDFLARLAVLGDDDFKLKIISLTTSSYVYAVASRGFISRLKARRAVDIIESVDDKVTFVSNSFDDIFKAEFLLKNKLNDTDIGIILATIIDQRLQNTLSKYFYQIKGDEIFYEMGYDKEYPILDALDDALPLDLKFGVEIECTGTSSRYVLSYNQKPLRRYIVKEEGSVTDGIEFTSPILQYSKEDLKSIYEVCDFIRQNGFYADDECGGHIHYSAKFLDNYSAWLLLFYLFSKMEKILFFISNKENTFPRYGISQYSIPISKVLKRFLPNFLETNSILELITAVQKISPKKQKYSLNLNHIGYEFDTIEFRMPNGSIDPDEIIKNILLFGNLLVLAKRLSRGPLCKRDYELLLCLDKAVNDDEKLEIFLQLVFHSEKNREIYRKRYRANYQFYQEDYLNFEDSFEDFTLLDIKMHI